MYFYIFLYLVILVSGVLSNIVVVFVTSELSGKKVFEGKFWNVLLKVLAAIGGSLLAYLSNDHIGRKRCIFLINLFFLIGTLLLTYTQKIYFQLIGTIFSLLAIGMSTVTYPIYIYETVPNRSFGFFLTTYRLAVPFGEFLLNLVLIRFKVILKPPHLLLFFFFLFIGCMYVVIYILLFYQVVYAVWIMVVIQCVLTMLLPETMQYLLKKVYICIIV